MAHKAIVAKISEVIEIPGADKIHVAKVLGENVVVSKEWGVGFEGRKTYTPNPDLPSCVIVDVDGTVAKMNDRGPFEWAKVGTDTPREMIILMVQQYYDCGYDIVVCSGRSDECFEETSHWLVNNNVPFNELLMRKKGDYRKDNEVKEEIFWTHIAERYNVLAAIDDRPVMIRLWHELRIPNVIAVADPYIEF